MVMVMVPTKDIVIVIQWSYIEGGEFPTCSSAGLRTALRGCNRRCTSTYSKTRSFPLQLTVFIKLESFISVGNKLFLFKSLGKFPQLKLCWSVSLVSARILSILLPISRPQEDKVASGNGKNWARNQENFPEQRLDQGKQPRHQTTAGKGPSKVLSQPLESKPTAPFSACFPGVVEG